MASNRKLLAEVDRTLKKVQEGVELFDDIYEKVYDASSNSLKEKHETDLKKEIKKLQRLRDSIKSWISNTDIKDDTQLVEAKKLIEVKMEQFKICERETKTKTYSKEGLAKAARDEEDEEEEEEPESWVHAMLKRFTEEYEEMKSEMQLLENSRKKKDQKKLASYERKSKMHKFHIDNLELIIQVMDKDALALDELDLLKDDLDLYAEHCTESGYEMDADVYNHFELEDRLACAIAEEEAAKDASAALAKAAEDEKERKKREADEKRRSEHQQLLKAQQDRARILKEQEEAKRLRKEQQAREKEKREKLKQDQSLKRQVASAPSVAAVVAGAVGPTASATNASGVLRNPSEAAAPTSAQAATVPDVAVSKSPAVVTGAPTAVGLGSSEMNGAVVASSLASDKSGSVVQNGVSQPAVNVNGSATNGSANLWNTTNFQLLDHSTKFIPDLQDSGQFAHEKQDKILATTKYYPRHPMVTPPAFPQAPLKMFQDPAVFKRMDAELLFFIFYHQQGTYQQYLASKELKKQSWRYHKKYLTWFQRHSDPTTVTGEMEVGTYVYFDFETGWCKRVKSGFSFEYQFLEDD